MILAAMQPYFFPYIGYFQLICACDYFVILDDVHYIRGGWINRNRIFSDGRTRFFTLPLRHSSQNRLILEISISPEFNIWKRKFFKTLAITYGNAPYYEETMVLIQNILEFDSQNLAAFVSNSIKILIRKLGIDVEVKNSSDISVKKQAGAENRIFELCDFEKASMYLNPEGGRALYFGDNFKRKGLELYFLESELVEYPQDSADFIPGLSIIDVLMNCSADELAVLLNSYRISAAENV